MKQLLRIQGGYPRQMDYLLNLQAELLTMGNSLFAGLGVDLALSGCAVTDNGNGTINIAPGVVFISGEVIRYDGVSNLAGFSTKTLIKGAPVTSDPKIFKDTLPKNVYTETKAIIANKSSILQIQIKNTGLYNLKDYISDTIAASDIKGVIKMVYDFDGTFLANFDASGLGISPRWKGWARLNGNNGTVNAEGRTLINAGRYLDPVTGIQTIYSNGDTGGEQNHRLTIQEMPNHSHPDPDDQTQGDGGSPGYVYGQFQQTRQKNTGAVGGDVPHNNMQPYLAVHYVVKIN